MTDNNKIKKRIMLVCPCSNDIKNKDRFKCFNDIISGNFLAPPTKIMILASIAENIGYDVKISDYRIGGSYTDDLKEFNPDYVLVDVKTQSFKADIELLTIAKEFNPQVITIGVGNAFLTIAQDVMYFAKDLDYLIYGEPEDTFKELLLGIAPYRILGLYYRDDIRVKYTGVRPYNFDLDSIPFPARHLIDNEKYARCNNAEPVAVIESSRGCSFQCFYCIAGSESGYKIRKRSLQCIVEELKECIDKYGIRNFKFAANFFNADKNWVKELCRLIIEENLNIIWETDIRPEGLEEDLVELMHKSGCRLVNIEVDSGSEEILKAINKKNTLDDIRLTIRIFKKFGILINNHFLMGLPWETEDSIEDTIDFMLELDSDFVDIFFPAPYPGTKFYSYAKENNLIDANTSFKRIDSIPAVKSLNYTKEELINHREKALKKFYYRPSYILKIFINSNSGNELRKNIQTCINLLLNLKFYK